VSACKLPASAGCRKGCCKRGMHGMGQLDSAFCSPRASPSPFRSSIDMYNNDVGKR
jgi:hypothetical protein